MEMKVCVDTVSGHRSARVSKPFKAAFAHLRCFFEETATPQPALLRPLICQSTALHWLCLQFSSDQVHPHFLVMASPLFFILLSWSSVALSSSPLRAPDLFPEVVLDVPGRPPSTHFTAELYYNSTWTPIYVFETISQPSLRNPSNGYFQHLQNWSSSWVSSQLPSAPGSILMLRVRRVGGRAITTAVVHPVSSGAKVVNISAEDGVLLSLDHPGRLVVDMDGEMDATDTSQDYTGPPRHTFCWFVDTQLSPAELPDPASSRTLIVYPGDAWPTGLDPAQGLTVVFAPGVHYSSISPPPPRGWVVYTLAAETRYFLCAGAVVHSALTAGRGSWGQGGVAVGGYGVLSGEAMVREDNPTNDSPQGIFFTGLHNASITGVTLVDFPNHHIVAGQAAGNVLRNIKVMGWRTNGDGVHVFSSWTVSDLFLRTQDDSLYLTCGDGCNATFDRITTWNDANGVAFLFSPGGGNAENVVFRDSDAIYSRTSWFWWGPNTVFVQRGAGQGVAMSGVRVENVRVEDPLPAFNPFRIELFASGVTACTFRDVSFTNITVANFSTIRKDLAGKPLPHGIPNTIFAAPQGRGDLVNISNVAFNGVTIAGIAMRDLISDPTIFNLSSGNLFNVTVDGVPV